MTHNAQETAATNNSATVTAPGASSAPSGGPSKTITMFFDATCPFAWVTSRWLLEVEKVRDIQVQWAPMSLGVLNEDNDFDEGYRQMIDATWAPARVCAAVSVEHPDKLGELYTALGTRIHDRGEADKQDPHGYDRIIEAALAEVGLPAELAAAAEVHGSEGGAYDKQLRESHERGISLVGDDVGTPVVQLGKRAFFGPVLTRIPRGETAGELFDAAVTLGTYAHFYELKRSRDEGPKAEFAD